MRNFKGQLRSLGGDLIQTSGGTILVTTAGTSVKVALKDKDGGALANPLALNYGAFDFYVADTVASVDMFIVSPTGHGIVKKAVKPSGDSSIAFNSAAATSTIVIPFSYADQTGDATETDTGVTLPGAVKADPTIEVVTTDSGITIEIGTLSTASGDADGFLDAVSCATAGIVKGTLTNGSVTLGALLKVQDSANAGDAVPEQSSVSAGKKVSYTLLTGADTAAGYIILNVALKPSLLV